MDEKADPSEDSERQELQRKIWEALRGLASQHTEILVLRDYQDLSYREISEVLSIPQGTVMSRLHTARGRLRQHLVAEGWTFGGPS